MTGSTSHPPAASPAGPPVPAASRLWRGPTRSRPIFRLDPIDSGLPGTIDAVTYWLMSIFCDRIEITGAEAWALHVAEWKRLGYEPNRIAFAAAWYQWSYKLQRPSEPDDPVISYMDIEPYLGVICADLDASDASMFCAVQLAGYTLLELLRESPNGQITLSQARRAVFAALHFRARALDRGSLGERGLILAWEILSMRRG